jgi:pimeloyl-ACP methyl ester carboxylesterase
MIRLIRLGTPSDRPLLVAIPGIDGSMGSLDSILRRLAQDREVIAVDYSAETNPTLEMLTAEITAVLQAEGRPMFDLVGQSIGTVMAAQLAADTSLPVRRVALVCTFTRLNSAFLRLAVLSLRLTPGFLARPMSDLSIMALCGPVGDGRDNPVFAGARSANQAGVAKRTGWEIDRDFALDLAKIRKPTLILMGEQDRFVPNAKREVEKLRTLFAVRPARVETIPNAGHIFLPTAAIALASEKISAFLES